jgi:EmrB/QacA subfamily drug resistance transporter
MTLKDDRARWFALYTLCAASLMIVLDATIVNVALPSIRDDLGFSESSLAWVVNAYTLTFGGLLLLGGRLGDLYGPRRLFLFGLSLFTLASLACGLATSQNFLITARAVQGVGGAVASAVSLSLMMSLFTKPADRAKAMGLFGFVASGGGSIGVVLGGVLTDTINWHWIFLVNLPIGVVVVLLAFRLLPGGGGTAGQGVGLDAGGAVTVTAALMVAVYAIVNGNQDGWTSGTTLGRLAVAVGLLAVFLVIETRVSSPLMPLGLFRLRNLSTASVVGILWAGAMFAWFFLSALYLQLVLGYSPLKVGLGFLPGNLVMGFLSIGVSARLVMRFGIKKPLAAGLLVAAAGLLLFARAPVDGSYLVDVLPGMILLGFGAGIAFNPVLLAAMSDVKPEESGLASGIVNTSFMMGGALGLAVLASIAASRTSTLTAAGHSHLSALAGGYHTAFVVGALFATAAAITGGYRRSRAALDALCSRARREPAPLEEHRHPDRELEEQGERDRLDNGRDRVDARERDADRRDDHVADPSVPAQLRRRQCTHTHEPEHDDRQLEHGTACSDHEHGERDEVGRADLHVVDRVVVVRQEVQ